MRKLIYMGLESYQARYTYQLTDWSERVFKRRGIDYVIVPGQEIDNTKSIQVGQVLDAHGRSFFSMSQMMNLVQMMRNGEVTGEDVIFFEDMFTPGIESLGYIMNQIPEKDRPKVFVRCLAQTIDPDDFVHVWGMSDWMSLFEKMVNAMPNIHVLATNEEMVAHMRIAGWKAPIYNISGLAFSKEEVRSRVENIPAFQDRPLRVVFAARWDQEKQPDFYMDLIERVHTMDSNIEFCVLQGGPLRSNNPKYIERARILEYEGKLSIHENLTKNAYYEILANSRVLFNCALQDWVSNTVSEADALGTNVLYPAYRSFPETFANDHDRLYVPWSLDSAEDKLLYLLAHENQDMGKISDWTNGTVDRCIDIMEGTGEKWRRDGNRYRDYVAESKF
jgi:glycosyltransferase involved in cell wall biosynthesis